jgi:hypothetical protein
MGQRLPGRSPRLRGVLAEQGGAHRENEEVFTRLVKSQAAQVGGQKWMVLMMCSGGLLLIHAPRSGEGRLVRRPHSVLGLLAQVGRPVGIGFRRVLKRTGLQACTALPALPNFLPTGHAPVAARLAAQAVRPRAAGEGGATQGASRCGGGGGGGRRFLDFFKGWGVGGGGWGGAF